MRDYADEVVDDPADPTKVQRDLADRERETVVPTLWACVTAEQWRSLMALPKFAAAVDVPPAEVQDGVIGPSILGRVLVDRPAPFGQTSALWLLFFEAGPVTTEALANIASYFGGDLPRVKQIVWRPER